MRQTPNTKHVICWMGSQRLNIIIGHEWEHEIRQQPKLTLYRVPKNSWPRVLTILVVLCWCWFWFNQYFTVRYLGFHRFMRVSSRPEEPNANSVAWNTEMEDGMFLHMFSGWKIGRNHGFPKVIILRYSKDVLNGIWIRGLFTSMFTLNRNTIYIHIYGYGSIPINTIFSGMNIHKSQLFWCELQGYKVLTHCHIYIYIHIQCEAPQL